MIEEILNIINTGFCKCFPGLRFYGLTYLDRRDNLTIPVYITETGIREVVVDDSAPMIIYHRQNSISSSLQAGNRSGYGDALGDVVNVHEMSMYVYANNFEKKQHEIFLAVQSVINTNISNLPPFKSVRVLAKSANLNSVAIWNAEYTANTPNRLPLDSILMQINYSITSTSRVGCFDCKIC